MADMLKWTEHEEMMIDPGGMNYYLTGGFSSS